MKKDRKCSKQLGRRIEAKKIGDETGLNVGGKNGLRFAKSL